MAEKHKKELVRGLLETECFQTGEFKLKSGLISPFYIDLRMVISAPNLLRRVASAFASMLRPVRFDRLAGIPLAGVPIVTAVSILLDKPFVIPRVDRKDHGTGRAIEGFYQKGERIAVLDDLITTGGAKFEAIEVLHNEGLVVEDLVVLIERGKNARGELMGKGVRLHSYLKIEELLDLCEEEGQISTSQRHEIDAFLLKS